MRRSLGGRGVDHQDEALLGRWELGDVVLGVGTTDMLLHGAISLFLQPAIADQHLCLWTWQGQLRNERWSETHADAPLATAGAIVVLQRADDLVIGVRDREGAGEARPWRHSKL